MDDHTPVLRALGVELKARREQLGMSRVAMCDQLRSHGLNIVDRTLVSYEQGTRAVSVERLLQLCSALGASPTAVLTAALERAGRHPCPTCGQVPG